MLSSMNTKLQKAGLHPFKGGLDAEYVTTITATIAIGIRRQQRCKPPVHRQYTASTTPVLTDLVPLLARRAPHTVTRC